MLKLLQCTPLKISRELIRFCSQHPNPNEVSQKSLKYWNRAFYGFLAVSGGIYAFGFYIDKTIAKASGFVAHPQSMPNFPDLSVWHGHDVFAVRRGYQVYKQVCAACHAIDFFHYRDFIGKIMTKEEAEKEAAESAPVEDINDKGQKILRPRTIHDRMPRPYKNSNEAKTANNGVEPPPFTLIVPARHGGTDYIFSLLTGYQDAPAGVTVGEGQAYNPYFPGGGVLSMPQQLFDDGVSYEDGTPATQSQQAKDITSFLRFLCEHDMEFRRRMALKMFFLLIPLAPLLVYYKRFYCGTLKTTKLIFKKYPWRKFDPKRRDP